MRRWDVLPRRKSYILRTYRRWHCDVRFHRHVFSCIFAHQCICPGRLYNLSSLRTFHTSFHLPSHPFRICIGVVKFWNFSFYMRDSPKNTNFFQLLINRLRQRRFLRPRRSLHSYFLFLEILCKTTELTS